MSRLAVTDRPRGRQGLPKPTPFTTWERSTRSTCWRLTKSATVMLWYNECSRRPWQWPQRKDPLREERGSRVDQGQGTPTEIPYRLVYEPYIASPAWQARRASYFTEHSRSCDACASEDEVELHHRTYERFTHELDDDLRALCSTCHQWVHHLHRSSRLDLAESTDQVIAARSRRTQPIERPEFVKTRGFSNIDMVFAKVRGRPDLLPGQYRPTEKLEATTT